MKPLSLFPLQSLLLSLVVLFPSSIHAKWNATGNMRTIWVTHVMEYRDLFSKEQLDTFASDVLSTFANFTAEQSNPETRRNAKPQAQHTSTPFDKDRLNEEFFNYQSRFPVNGATLETVWQAFSYSVQRFLLEAQLPPISYSNGYGGFTTTDVQMPQRGKQYCWGSVQSKGVHHDLHTHPGAAIAGTLYLQVPPEGAGALTLSDPRGPLPPFNYAYRIAPEAGMFVLFPATLPHGVHATAGDAPRVSISCNFPGDWNKFTRAQTIAAERVWSQEMLTAEEAEAERKAEEKKTNKRGEL